MGIHRELDIVTVTKRNIEVDLYQNHIPSIGHKIAHPLNSSVYLVEDIIWLSGWYSTSSVYHQCRIVVRKTNEKVK